jgi:hypothetical protein
MNKVLVSSIMCFILSCGCGVETGDDASRDPQTGVTSISGRVVDRVTNQPIQGVRVSTNPPTTEDISNSDGKYLLTEQLTPNQLYLLVASANGYEQDTASASVADQENKVVNFNLQPTLAGGLNVSPSELNFGNTTSSLQTNISSDVGSSLNFTINQPLDPWLSIQEPFSGTVSTQTASRTLTVNRSGLSAGSYQTSFTITSDSGSTVTVVARMTVQ